MERLAQPLSDQYEALRQASAKLGSRETQAPSVSAIKVDHAQDWIHGSVDLDESVDSRTVQVDDHTGFLHITYIINVSDLVFLGGVRSWPRR